MSRICGKCAREGKRALFIKTKLFTRCERCGNDIISLVELLANWNQERKEAK